MNIALLAAVPAWQSAEGYRFQSPAVDASGSAGFSRISPVLSGLNFTNHLSEMAIARNRLLANGSGVTLGDVDGDGWVDAYFCRLEGDNVLYRNLGGWKFEDITAAAGVGCPGLMATGCALADLDGDEDLDLVVNSLGGGTRVFINDGQAHFAELKETRLVREFGATSLALGDVDGDGDLDLYVTNYRSDTFHDPPKGFRIESRQLPDGRAVIEPQDRFIGLPTLSGTLEVIERGEPDFFYLNRGGTNFVPAPWTVGVFLDEAGDALESAPTDWGLSVMFRDFNGDQQPDLFICNDFIYWPDRLWLNQGGRRFQAAPKMTFRSTSLASMCVDVADINRDGFDDFFVADMPSPRRENRLRQRPDMLGGTVRWPVEDPEFRPELPRNTLQLARGDGTFAEIAVLAGVAASDWTWSSAFLDVDLDGWEDLLLTTGNPHDLQDADTQTRLAQTGGWRTPERRVDSYRQFPSRAAPQVAFRNRHDLTFEDASGAWRFDAVGVAHGMALGDLDNDGDLDVVVNCLNEPARLFRNDCPAPRLAVRLKGAQGNTRGIGAKIRITGGPVAQRQEMQAGGRYCSSDDPMRCFAAGRATALDVEVTWRSGRRSLLRGVRPNQIIEVTETANALAPVTNEVARALFEDASARLKHVHVDAAFDDFGRQSLLPHKLSTLGPGVAWNDLDGDGDDDLLIGGGKDGRLVVYRNEGSGGLVEWEQPGIPKSNVRDQTSVVVLKSSNAPPRVVVGTANWEDARPDANRFDLFLFGTNSSASGAVAPAGAASTGPMAVADVDGDGDLDLFVGARAAAGRYPEKADSLLFGNDGGSFVERQRLTAFALVSGAVFTDYDDDGDPDLVLACEWDSLRLLRNDGGKFIDVTGGSGLERFKGFWNGVTAGDFDGDGRMDLVASNWGRNWRSDQTPGVASPAQLFYGDFAGNGAVATIMASLDPYQGSVTPWRDWGAMRNTIPSILERLRSHQEYSRASVDEVLGEMTGIAKELSADSFDSMVFLNRGGRFEGRPLPVEAQFAAAFGVSVADFDGDGSEDVFLAQNFFGVDAESSRQDAGVGLVLLGDGGGGFRALRPAEAGVRIYGEQRGSAVADFDQDGRPDLAVGQSRGTTQLLRNSGGRAGIRVKLKGSSDNPDGVGASIRLFFGDRPGPRREIHGGSGFLGQDAEAPILAAPAPPNQIEVRWPGGRLQRMDWPAGALKVIVSPAGLRPW